MFESKTCPVCKTEQVHYIFEAKDYLVSGKNFSIYECNSCSFRFTNPFPLERDLKVYYDSPEYISHSTRIRRFSDRIYFIIRRKNTFDKIKLIGKYQKPGQLLDVGSGVGFFLEMAAIKGWAVNGIEPNYRPKVIQESQSNIIVLDSLFSNQLKPFSYDAITMWHVLEHIPELQKAFSRVKDLLKPNGTLFLALPNWKSWDAKFYGNEWAAFDVPRHLYHFSQDSVKVLAERNGMVLIKTVPIVWDAFYISLLSERIRASRFPMLNALINGCVSNFNAFLYGNYSSLIYIIKNKSSQNE